MRKIRGPSAHPAYHEARIVLDDPYFFWMSTYCATPVDFAAGGDPARMERRGGLILLDFPFRRGDSSCLMHETIFESPLEALVHLGEEES